MAESGSELGLAQTYLGISATEIVLSRAAQMRLGQNRWQCRKADLKRPGSRNPPRSRWASTSAEQQVHGLHYLA